jgi:superfamily I DNA/RNA helicase
MNLSNLQEKIAHSTATNIIVMAAAASGKTAVLTERVKWLLDNGADPSKMVVFTFTNAAAEEMRSRIGEKGKDVFINTVHSYAFYLLLKNGIDAGKAASEERFDDFFKMIENNPDCIDEVEYLLLDEAQDSNLLQYKFILEMIKPKNLFIVGDYRQSIYEWNGGRPDILMGLTYRKDFMTYSLNENYRNGPTILSFAKRLIGTSVYEDEPLIDDSICMKEFEADHVAEVPFSKEDLVFRIKKSNAFGDWFVLARSNAQVDQLMEILKDAGIPCDTFKRSQITADEFKTKMNANTVKILTVHASKGLEADNVYVVGVAKWNKKAEERRLAYVAATRARKQLIWAKEFKKRPKINSWE